MAGPVFVNAAEGGTSVADEEGTLEHDLTAVAALLAFSIAVFELAVDVALVEAQQKKAPDFASPVIEISSELHLTSTVNR